MSTMNHDITHCKGVVSSPSGAIASAEYACPRRENCKRYLAHLDAQQHPVGHLLSYVEASECIATNYKLQQ